MPATLDEVYDALVDNADFEEVASVAKAKLFATAASRFLILSPQSQSDQGSSLTMSVAQIENLLKRARGYIDQNASGASNANVRFLSASQGFRR